MDQPQSTHSTDPHAESGDEFDALARRAAASLREPASPTAMSKVISAGRRRQRAQTGTIVAALVLLAGGIAFSARSAVRKPPVINVIPKPDSTFPALPSSTTVAPLAVGPLEQWTQTYTGNPSGPATGTPVKIGLISASDAWADTKAVTGAAQYLNASAGGVGGRPIELVTCNKDTGEATADCVNRIGDDPSVSAVLWSTTYSDSSLTTIAAIADKKPALTPFVCFCQEDRTTGRVVTMQPAHLDAVAGAAHLVDRLSGGRGRVGVLTDSGATAVELTKSVIGAERTVWLGSPPLSLNDPDKADINFFVADVGFPCSEKARQLKEIRPTAVVVGVFCGWDADGPPEGWYSIGPGFNPTTMPNDSGADTIVTRVGESGDTAINRGASMTSLLEARWAADLFILVRIMNAVGGPDKATTPVLQEAIRNYKGPVPLFGDVDCSPTGKSAAVTPGDCISTVPVFQYVNGAWVDREPVSALRAPDPATPK